MKFVSILTLIVLVFSLPALADNPQQTETSVAHNAAFVEGQSQWFLDAYKADDAVAFATRFGYGTGTYSYLGETVDFTWFCWANSDAYVQLSFDLPIAEAHFGDVMAVKDRLDRPWDIAHTADGSYLGTSNMLILDSLDGDTRYTKKDILDLTLDQICSLPFIETMDVAAYY